MLQVQDLYLSHHNMKTDNNGARSWIQNNLWNLLVTAAAIIITFASISARVSALEERADTIVGVTRFEEFRKDMTDRLTRIEDKLDRHLEKPTAPLNINP